MSGRTISIEVDTETGTENKHFNVDNITFLEASYSELSDFAQKLRLGITGGVFVLLFVFFDWVWGLVGAAIAFFVVSAALFVPNTTQIGTVTETYELEENTVGIENQFLDAAREVITIEGGEEGRYREHTYRYHVVPENAVSISHRPTEPFPLGGIFLAIGVLVVAGTFFLDVGSEAYVVGGALLALGVYLDPVPRPDTVTIEFGTGETEEFDMASADAHAFIDEFNDRSGGHATIQESEAPATDPVPDEFDQFDADREEIMDALVDPESVNLDKFDDDLRKFVETTNEEYTKNLFGKFADKLRSSDPETRREGLGMVDGTRVDVNNFDLVVPPLLSLFARADDPDERAVVDDVLSRVARRAPEHFESSIDHLCDLLEHDDPEVRVTAADLLAAVSDTHRGAIEDRQTTLRRAAENGDDALESRINGVIGRAGLDD